MSRITDVAAVESHVSPGFTPDLNAILRPMLRGRTDPTLRLDGTVAWRTAVTPDGPVTQRLVVADARVASSCWGPGAEWMATRTPDLIGANDHGWATFDPAPGLVADHWRRHRNSWRVPRAHNVWESAVAAVLEQKVTGLEAKRAWHALAREFGEPAPGPAPEGLRVLPDPQTVRRVPSWWWRRNAVDRTRSDTIMRLAAIPHVLWRLPHEASSEARRLLTCVRGVGDWTYAEVAQRALGDPDAVSVGDFHLAADLVYALTGSFAGDDEQMLALLQPYTVNRYRAVRMLELSRVTRPRRGPRFAVPAHRYG